MIQSEAQLRLLLKSIPKKSSVLIYSPQGNHKNIISYLDSIIACFESSSILTNRHTPKYKLSYIKIFIKYLIYLLNIPSRIPRLRIGTLSFNTFESAYYWRRYYQPLRLQRVPSFDIDLSPISKPLDEERYGIIYDSYLPFHQEMIKYGTAPDPETFYRRLNSLILWLKEKYCLKTIYFCKHPNSHGNELVYMTNSTPFNGNLNQLTRYSLKTWSFGSDASFIANYYNRHCAYISFPDLLPANFTDYIHKKSTTTGFPLYIAISDNFNSLHIKIPLFTYIKKLIIRFLYGSL